MKTGEDFDHHSIYDEEVAQRLGQFYETARQQCPIINTDADGGYSILTRFDDVKEALGDPKTFSSSWGVPKGKMEPPITVDPPTHRDYRLLLNRFFSYRSLEPHQARIREIANRHIDQWIDKDEVEFLAEFADPFTAVVLAEVIFNDTDSSWTYEVQKIHENSTKGDYKPYHDFTRQVANDKMDARLASGVRKDDVLDAILHGTIEGRPLTQEEREGTLMTLFGGGLDTTRASLTGIMLHTARAPELEDRLRNINWEDPTLDEFVRELSPVAHFGRIATTDTELGDHEFAAGTKFVVSFFSANHDETKFPNPNELDFDRDAKQHVGFGYGIHRCIGMQLAKLQIGIGLQELFKRITNVRLIDDEIVYCAGLPRVPKHLRLAFDRVPG
jgi:cytochrome P450